MSDEPEKIMTHEEHRKLIRKFWWIGITSGAAIIALDYAFVLFLKFGMDLHAERIVQLNDIAFKAVILGYGSAFVMPSVLTTMTSMLQGLQMSRMSLKLGQRTAENLDHLQKRLEEFAEKATKKGVSDLVDKL